MSEAILPTQAITQEDQQTKEWTPAKVIYVFLMAFNLLSHLWLQITGTGINMPIYIWIPRIAAAALAIYLGKLWKDTGFRILAVYTLLFSLRAAIPNPANIFTDDISESILSALWLFAGCYGLARSLSSKQIKLFFMIISLIWTAGMTCLCYLGIDAAWTGWIYHFAGNGYINLNGYRLNLLYVPTISAAIMGMTILAGIIVIRNIRKRIVRIVYIILLLPIVLTLCLSDTRTAYVGFSLGIGVFFFSDFYCYIQNKKQTAEKKTIRRLWICGAVITIGICILIVFLIMQITTIFNQLKIRGLIPRAYAAGRSKILITTRGFSGENVFTGRAELWTKIFEYLNKNKYIFIIGNTKLTPIIEFEDYYGHCHCLYLQVLLESGIPGLLLVVSFIIYTVINAIRAITNPKLPLWIRLLPGIVVSILVPELVECLLWLRASYAPMITVFFISAGILNTLVPKKPKKKSLPESVVEHSF